MGRLTAVVLAIGLLSPLAVPGGAQESAAVPAPGPIDQASDTVATDGTPEARARAMVARWQDLLTELEETAREADSDTLQTKHHALMGLTEEMSLHVATGHEELMARALRIGAVLAALRAQSEGIPEASFSSFAEMQALQYARLLWPPITDDLDTFGSVGSVLHQRLQQADREAGELQELAAQMRSKEDFVPPNPQGSRDIRYPPAARAAGLEAVVSIRYLIDEDGIPASPEVLDRNIPSSLLIAALDAVLAWRFEPAMVGSRLVPAEDTVAVRFETPQ